MASLDVFQQVFDETKAGFLRNLASSHPSLKQDILSTSSIEQVYDTIDKLQLEHAKQGHNRNFSRIQSFLEGLESYSAVSEIFVQVKPEILALIWGPIKLLLLLTSNARQAFDAVLKVSSAIGDLLPKFQRVREIFREGDTRLKRILGLFYKDILDFYSISLEFFSKTRVEVFFETLWPNCRKKIQFIEGLLEKHAQLLQNEVTFENIRQEYENREQVLAALQKTFDLEMKQSFELLKSSIAPKFYYNKLADLRNHTCRDTAEWLGRDADFKTWINGSTSPEKKILWVHGIPGSGKTFLASWIIGEAEKTGKALFVFCTYKCTNIKAISIIHSLLFQLASEDETLQAVLTETKRRSLESNTKAAIDILKTAIETVDLPFVIVDGLDEIDAAEQKLILYTLLDVLKECPSMRLCLTGRVEDNIEKIIKEQCNRIRVDSKNFESIQSYVKGRFEKWMKENPDFGTELKTGIQELTSPVADKANGMFLYARIIFDNVQFLSDPGEIRSELKALPKDLDEAYQRVFSRINGLGTLQKDKARKILAWIGCAPTLMTTRELDQALLVSEDTIDIPIVRAPTAITQLCGPLVEVVNDIPQFVHFTVKEYIFSPQIKGFISLPNSINQLLETCCMYLCSRDFDKNYWQNDTIKDALLSGKFRLLGFACSNWFPIVMKSLQLSCDVNHLDDLDELIQKLVEERTNDNFAELEGNIQSPGFEHILRNSPETCQFLTNACRFFKHERRDEWTIEQTETWTIHDPLVLSQLHAQVDNLRLKTLCQKKPHEEDCHCSALVSHYGEKVYPCTFFSCSFRRTGFASHSSFRDHIQHHNRPYKCNDPRCEYSFIGFPTDVALRSHWEKYHRKLEITPVVQATEITDGDIEASLSLLFDMVKSDDINGLCNLWPRCVESTSQKRKISLQLGREIAYSGSLSMFRAFLDLLPHDTISEYNWADFTEAAIIRGNLEVFRYCFSTLVSKSKYGNVSWKVMESTSFEISLLWQEIILQSSISHSRTNDSPLFSQRIFEAAENNPMQEIRLLQTWQLLHDRGKLTTSDLGGCLVNIGRTNCNIPQAEMILKLGVPIDYRKIGAKSGVAAGPTALYSAARVRGEKAARFMEFLLFNGANPKLGFKGTYPRDGRGAQKIQRWLGITWDELVQKAKERSHHTYAYKYA